MYGGPPPAGYGAPSAPYGAPSAPYGAPAAAPQQAYTQPHGGKVGVSVGWDRGSGLGRHAHGRGWGPGQHACTRMLACACLCVVCASMPCTPCTLVCAHKHPHALAHSGRFRAHAHHLHAPCRAAASSQLCRPGSWPLTQTAGAQGVPSSPSCTPTANMQTRVLAAAWRVPTSLALTPHPPSPNTPQHTKRSGELDAGERGGGEALGGRGGWSASLALKTRCRLAPFAVKPCRQCLTDPSHRPNTHPQPSCSAPWPWGSSTFRSQM